MIMILDDEEIYYNNKGNDFRVYISILFWILL